MTTKQFIDSLFEKLFTSFNTIENVSYRFDVLSNTHYVLIPKAIFETSEFTDFDFDVTNESFEVGIQGMICFITEYSTQSSNDFETIFNSLNNNVILRNLGQFVTLSEFFKNGLLQPKDVVFSDYDTQKIWGAEIAGESNYALAA